MGESSIREIVERVVSESLERHISAMRSELVERACEELAPTFTGRAAAPAGATSDLLKAAVNSVQDANSQADILSALVEEATRFAPRCALFVIRSGSGVGWRASGLGNDEAIKTIQVDTNRGLAGRAMQDRLPAAAAAEEFDDKFLSTFGAPREGTNALLLPLVVREKVAALLYADAGGTAAGTLDASALECLVRMTGLWLEVLAARKAGTQATIAEPPPAPAEKPLAAAAGAEPSPPPAPAAEPAPSIAASAGDDEVHKKARRFAKLLVDEIKLYNRNKVEEGRRRKDLYQRLKEDIDKSRAAYEKRYGQTPAASGDYFTQELIRILGDGDATALGGGF